MTEQQKIDKAIEIAVQHGGHDGAHHKDWVIDQMVRVLAGDDYDTIVADAISCGTCGGTGHDGTGEDAEECEDCEGTGEGHEWNCGIAP